MREQAPLRACQPWLAGQEDYVIMVDKVCMHAASVGGRFAQQSSGKPTYVHNMQVLWLRLCIIDLTSILYGIS